MVAGIPPVAGLGPRIWDAFDYVALGTPATATLDKVAA